MKLTILMAGIAIALSPVVAQAKDQLIDVSGFGSLYYGQALDKRFQPYGFTDNYADFTHFSLVGLTFKSRISEEWDAAVQLVATGDNLYWQNFSTFMEWAYLNYQPTAVPGLSVRVGRQRYGVWTASEYMNVHHELPFRALPGPVYRITPFSSFDGISVGQNFNVGKLKGNVAVFGGAPVQDIPPTSNNTTTLTTTAVERHDLLGVKASIDGDGWRARIQASETTAIRTTTTETVSGSNIQTTVSKIQAHQQIFTAGYRFDKYNIVSWAEYAYLISNDGTQATYNTYHKFAAAGYALLGYRIGDWMPRLSFAGSNVSNGISLGNVQSYIAGVNYAIRPDITIKADYEYSNVGLWRGSNMPGTLQSGQTDGVGKALYIGVDFLF